MQIYNGNNKKYNKNCSGRMRRYERNHHENCMTRNFVPILLFHAHTHTYTCTILYNAASSHGLGHTVLFLCEIDYITLYFLLLLLLFGRIHRVWSTIRLYEFVLKCSRMTEYGSANETSKQILRRTKIKLKINVIWKFKQRRKKERRR